MKKSEKREMFGQKVKQFFAKNGFYTVLFLCISVIGVTAWLIAYAGISDEKEQETLQMSITAKVPEIVPEPPATAHVKIQDAEDIKSSEPVEKAENVQQNEEAEKLQADSADRVSVPEAAAVFETAPSLTWPIGGEVSKEYSLENLIYSKTLADWRTHSGIDIAGTLGDKVMAAEKGLVEDIYEDPLYGTTVVISHGGGLKSIYSNLAQIPTVSIGDIISRGDTIGSIGTTAIAEIGEVTHLHFEVLIDGKSTDPEELLPKY